jgi:hypothetical protein
MQFAQIRQADDGQIRLIGGRIVKLEMPKRLLMSALALHNQPSASWSDSISR